MNLADALEKLRNMIRDAEKSQKVEIAPWRFELIRKRWKFQINKFEKLSNWKIFIRLNFRQEKAARERLVLKRQRSDTKAQRQAPVVDF